MSYDRLWIGLFCCSIAVMAGDMDIDRLFSDTQSHKKVFKVKQKEYQDAIEKNRETFDRLNQKQRAKVAHFFREVAQSSKGVSGYCYAIRGEDSRNNCIANAKREIGYCYSIKSEDMRNSCIANLKREIGYCYSIKSEDMRNSCIANLKREIGFCYSIRNKDLMNSCIANFK